MTCLPDGLVTYAGKTARVLKQRKLSIVTAESCTAGLIAAVLSHANGATDILQGGFVTYTKEHKTKALGVSAALLKREGSVTAEVARQLARGALKRSRADAVLAVTGVLGPAPDEDGNPVGLVYFCCGARKGPMIVLRKRFPRQSHDRLLSLAVRTALDLIKTTLGADATPASRRTKGSTTTRARSRPRRRK